MIAEFLVLLLNIFLVTGKILQHVREADKGGGAGLDQPWSQKILIYHCYYNR